ncbi:MAG: nucleotidyl transferase AbiEii/AbiGii toxin family protein [Kiritimatiellae bacterium]|nr:nucleotidyl transferase AbiEii/AbiGii toxin family protein [Kiritimatiellia bacterium]
MQRKTHFFKKAAFYGGTCLHFFYGLPRFSEDLDFSLLQADPDFSLTTCFDAITTEFKSLGREVIITRKEKRQKIAIESAFLKDNTGIYKLSFKTEKTVKIKIDVDTSPPLEFQTENHTLMLPFSFVTRCFDLPSLYAGKMHALLFRNWKHRVKGRDWYDFEWYVRHRIRLDLRHFQQRMIQSHPELPVPETVTDLKSLIKERIGKLNVEDAKFDVTPFIKDTSTLEIWSREYFCAVADQVM